MVSRIVFLGALKVLILLIAAAVLLILVIDTAQILFIYSSLTSQTVTPAREKAGVL